MKNCVIILWLLFLQVASAVCQSVSVTVSAPQKVVVNQRFQLIFTIHNARPDSFSMPRMKHVKLLSGPSVGSSSSTQIVGGRMAYSTQVSHAYIAVADKKGKMMIPKAEFWIKQKKYETQEISIEVVDENEKQQAGKSRLPNENKPKIPEALADEVQGQDVFVKTEWQDENVYAGEHNTLVMKLYYRINVAGWDNLELPKYKNCEVTDAGIARNRRYGTAVVNGVKYNTVIIAQKDIVPDKAGRLVIGSGTVDIILNVRNKNDFWGGYHRASKKLTIPGLTVTVKRGDEKPKKQEETIPEMHWNL